MKEPNIDEIRKMLEQDSVGRNQQLSLLIKFINSFDTNVVISIDGRWGSGKTVFVKQLKLLADEGESAIPDHDGQISRVALRKFNEDYSVYYFNAWEHDYLSDPLQALLFRLISDFQENESVKAVKKIASKVDLADFIKNITKEAIDFDKKTTNEQLIKEIKDMVDRKEAVDNILNKYLNASGKRMLFIVDELDRCKPSFAVEMLEVMKHYFNNDQIVFLIATNVAELSHTIRKYYGDGFEGAKYLNRFFDYNLELRKVDHKKYITTQLGVQKDSYFKNSIPHDIATYLDLTMREANSFFGSLKLLDGYMGRADHWQPSAKVWLTQVVYVPLALALKVTQDGRYVDFMSGKGYELLSTFCAHSANTIHLAERFIEDKTDASGVKTTDLVVATYKEIFSRIKDYDRIEIQDEFFDAISLISSYSNIGSGEDAE